MEPDALLLHPGDGGSGEDARGSFVVRDTHHHGVSVKRNGAAELVTHFPIIGDQPVLLAPDPSGSREHIGSTNTQRATAATNLAGGRVFVDCRTDPLSVSSVKADVEKPTR
jgi:hypothetical protein